MTQFVEIELPDGQFKDLTPTAIYMIEGMASGTNQNFPSARSVVRWQLGDGLGHYLSDNDPADLIKQVRAAGVYGMLQLVSAEKQLLLVRASDIVSRETLGEGSRIVVRKPDGSLLGFDLADDLPTLRSKMAPPPPPPPTQPNVPLPAVTDPVHRPRKARNLK